MVQAVLIFLVAIAVIAIMGRVRRMRLGGSRCPACGRHRIGAGPCPCGKGA